MHTLDTLLAGPRRSYDSDDDYEDYSGEPSDNDDLDDSDDDDDGDDPAWKPSRVNISPFISVI